MSLVRLIVRTHRWDWRWWYLHIAINRLARRVDPYGHHWLWRLNNWAHRHDMDRMANR